MNKRVMELLQSNQEILKELAGGDLKTKGPATSMNANKLHGANGLFSTMGLERDIITAYVRPMGLFGQLPLYPSVNEDPRFGSITGFTGTTGSQPAAVCADAPYGYIKGCNLTARFGVKRFDTNTIDIEKVQLKVNRGDFTDLIMRGRLLGMDNVSPRSLTEEQVVSILTMSEMVTVGANFEREFNKECWQGVLNTNNAFPGLDVQVATGQKDADSGTACPAMDSLVMDFAYDLVGGTGRSIVEYLSMMEFYLRTNASSMGLDPVDFVVVMRPELWFEVSAVWPCAYMSYRCNNNSGTNITVVDGGDQVAMRDAMRNGMYIDINGNRYPVIVDTGIYERTNINDGNLQRGQYASSIYFLPLAITGGFPVLYREHIDYGANRSDISLLNGTQTFWSDGGAYSWAVEYVKWCFKLAARSEQRVILRTPQLAGRIQKVRYQPLQHLRSPFADDPYFMDGGVSVRGRTWGQAVWS